ncbi:hypothetical protein BUALT_Bualt15G0096200 [Buddleja alternifolia]|uniref:Uncharacterized protein n=1 Tax=Buddleja alternifolia TaxID=168488 RepID=A0AAV6WEH8_9LAMI|nr:hypothetical protein BUALT_Bualt15G0096200 [Buddleja alternifolia]
MKSYNSVSLLADSKSRSCLCSLFITMSLICGAYFIGSAWLGQDSSRLLPGIALNTEQQYTASVKCEVSSNVHIEVNDTREDTHVEKCNDKCRAVGSEALPKGIVSSTSNLEMRPLTGPVLEDNKSKHTTSLLAIAVGTKQKRLVNEIVKKFLENDFAVMLFHYDGLVDEWRDFEWCDNVVHISATNQTKWWFAKRFLHPDIVAEYEYIFLWDEDLGVENFHPGRYLSIIKEEGLEISQPGLDASKSEVHHHITVRNRRSRVHRRYYRLKGDGSGRCDSNSTAPPCVGWVEMMAPVFSRAAWRCSWYMIQGDRTVKVGVVDAEYVVHLGLPTLGGHSDKNKMQTNTELSDQSSRQKKLSESKSSAGSVPQNSNKRFAIRQRSYDEMKAFNKRWNNAVKEDECWVDPFERPAQRNNIH